MSQTKVKKLMPEQAALIPVYREKWRAIALSTGPINRSQAAETVKSAYCAIGKKAPEIIFVDRAYEAADTADSRFMKYPRLSFYPRRDTAKAFVPTLHQPGIRCIILSQIDSPMSLLRSQFETKLRIELEKRLRSYLGAHPTIISSNLTVKFRCA